LDASPVPSSAFRDALARFASGVTVVAAATDSGPVGFTATGFTSVSLSPPLVLVCIGRRASAHDAVVGAERFGVSVLSECQSWIAEQFARPRIDRFRHVPRIRAAVPLIDGASALLQCRRHALHEAGDHTILVGEVIEALVGAGPPLVHFARRYGAFVAESAPAAESAHPPDPSVTGIRQGRHP